MRSGRRRVCFVGSPNAILLLEPYKIPPSKEAQNRRQVALAPHRSCSSANIKGLLRRRDAFVAQFPDSRCYSSIPAEVRFRGLPSDAAMVERVECVMLNKGPHPA